MIEKAKLLEQYLVKLERAKEQEKAEIEKLIENITRVFFKDYEINELSLEYYNRKVPNLQNDIQKLIVALEYRKAQLLDNDRREQQQHEIQMKKMENDKLQLQAQIFKGQVQINNNNNNQNDATASASSVNVEKIGQLTGVYMDIFNNLNIIGAFEIQGVAELDDGKIVKFKELENTIRSIKDDFTDSLEILIEPGWSSRCKRWFRKHAIIWQRKRAKDQVKIRVKKEDNHGGA